MLKDIGVEYVLAGHSERRSLFHDSDTAINMKVRKILDDGLKAVLCIGETQEEYEAGLNHEVCAIQILKDLAGISAEDMANVVLAYEPVWAIGTGLVCPKEVAQEVHSFIRSTIAKKYGDEVASKVIIQYGGSVNPGNVKELMAMPDIDGCLVGGESLIIFL
jgi:triosephosphate isomerase